MAQPKKPPKYAAIRKIALALPGASEVVHYGHHFNVGTKTFVACWEPGGRWIMKLPKPLELMLFETRPETFQPMTHGRMFWAYVKVEDLSAAELRGLVIQAWRMVATKKLQATLPP